MASRTRKHISSYDFDPLGTLFRTRRTCNSHGNTEINYFHASYDAMFRQLLLLTTFVGLIQAQCVGKSWACSKDHRQLVSNLLLWANLNDVLT